MPIFEQELHLATLKHVLKCLLNRALHSPAPGVQGAVEIDLSGVFKGWSWAQQKRKSVSVLLYAINQANKKQNSTMCVYKMAKAFRLRRMSEAGPCAPRRPGCQGMPCHGGWLRMLFPPVGSSPHHRRCPRPETRIQHWPSQRRLVVYRLTEDPPPHLQVMVHTAFTNASAKNRKNTPNTATAQQRPRAPSALLPLLRASGRSPWPRRCGPPAPAALCSPPRERWQPVPRGFG